MGYCLHKLHHIALIPNSTQLMWSEVDLLSITRAGLAHEFEIKCRRSDYSRELGDNHKYNKRTKHWRLQNPMRYGNYQKNPVPNYFWFVTYEFEIDPPPYAGWMLVTKNEHYPGKHRLDERKKAPRIHTQKWDDKRIAKLARLLSFRLLKTYT